MKIVDGWDLISFQWNHLGSKSKLEYYILEKKSYFLLRNEWDMVVQCRRLQYVNMLKSRAHGNMVQNPILSNDVGFFFYVWHKKNIILKIFCRKICFKPFDLTCSKVKQS